MRQETLKKTGAANHRLIKLDTQLIPFNVSDILRCKCSCTIHDMGQVIKKMNQHNSIKVLRIKNRLLTENRDFLINFIFKDCKLICELQVGIKDKDDEKGTYQDHLNHFLHELIRAKFGCLS
jgi:hypothetical protein